MEEPNVNLDAVRWETWDTQGVSYVNMRVDDRFGGHETHGSASNPPPGYLRQCGCGDYLSSVDDLVQVDVADPGSHCLPRAVESLAETLRDRLLKGHRSRAADLLRAGVRAIAAGEPLPDAPEGLVFTGFDYVLYVEFDGFTGIDNEVWAVSSAELVLSEQQRSAVHDYVGTGVLPESPADE